MSKFSGLPPQKVRGKKNNSPQKDKNKGICIPSVQILNVFFLQMCVWEKQSRRDPKTNISGSIVGQSSRSIAQKLLALFNQLSDVYAERLIDFIRFYSIY